MAPSAITHDYYAVLEVDQTATSSEIIKSYKRLALLRHPDRNTTRNTTEAFQLLGAAYETLKDESKRRNYDLIYPRIKITRNPPYQSSQAPHSAPDANKPNQDDTKEATASLSAILRAKQERLASWSRTQKVYDDAIFELRRDIRKLQSAIREFEDIEKAERAEEAAAKSWSTWFLSPLRQKSVEVESEKEQKARDRLQRLHSKNFKERDLTKKESELREREAILRTKRQVFDDANKKDDITKAAIEERIRAQKERERLEKERLEREELQRARREQAEKDQRETERQWAEWREQQAAERKKREQAEETARKELKEKIRKARLEEIRKGQEQPARTFGAGSSRHFSESNTMPRLQNASLRELPEESKATEKKPR
ncbi:hypothetical protein EG329_005468 [Mollisiaceae sp. DMI_Dod_QoI]|nr:hypothetical protein EG329_005468 [Helotiales sp. DMI_Dod_QoI]